MHTNITDAPQFNFRTGRQNIDLDLGPFNFLLYWATTLATEYSYSKYVKIDLEFSENGLIYEI